MAEFTPNYNLKKPGQDDFYNIEDFNDNADIIDAELKKAQDHRENTSNPHKVMADQVGAINPNLLINGDFQVWQRGTNFDYDTVNVLRYCADRWFYFNASGYTGLHVQKVDEGLQFSSTNDIDHFMGISQTFESELAQSLAGKTITFSARLKASKSVSGFKLKIRYSNTGTTNPSSGPTDETEKTVDLTTNFQTFSFAWTVPEDAKGVSFVLQATSLPDNETTVTINWAKVEIGSVATAFSPRSYAEEIAMCQRYYLTGAELPAIGFISTANEAFFYIPTPTTVRNIPTIITSQDENGHVGRINFGDKSGWITSVTGAFLNGTNYVGIRANVTDADGNDLSSYINYVAITHTNGITIDAEIY